MRAGRELRQSFTQEAMGSAFTLWLEHPDPPYMRQAAAECFAELARLEGILSRFVEGSDIAPIGSLRSGGSARVHLETFQCLEVAAEIQRATAGAFDVAYATPRRAGSGPAFALDREAREVRALAPGVRLDLGGIGKGFALDHLAGLLEAWEITRALLAAGGGSTVLALEPPAGEAGWAVAFGPEGDFRRRKLARRALSGSGKAVRGEHVRVPGSGQPAARWESAWAAAPSGAVADALSTAFLAMPAAPIGSFLGRHPETEAWLLPAGAARLVEPRAVPRSRR